MADPRIFALFCVLLGGMGQGVVAPRLPELLGRDGGALFGDGGLALASGASATLMYLGIFVSTFRFGRVADAGRVHRLLGPGLLAYAVTLVGLGFARGEWAIFALRFLEGLSLSAVFVAADFLLGRLSPVKVRARWLSYYGVALSAGLLLGPAVSLAGARLLPDGGAAVALGFVAAIAAATGVVALRVQVPAVPAASDGRPSLAFAPLVAGAAYGFLEAGLVAVFPVLAVRELGVTPEYCLIAVIVAAAASSVLWGWLADRIGAKLVVRALLAGYFALPLALSRVPPAAGGTAIAFSACAAFGILAGGLYPVGFAWLLETVPEAQYGFASGGFARAYGLGSLAGPIAAGLAAQSAGARGMFVCFAFVGAFALLGVRRADLERVA
jgi:MFS family permease